MSWSSVCRFGMERVIVQMLSWYKPGPSLVKRRSEVTVVKPKSTPIKETDVYNGMKMMDIRLGDNVPKM